VSMFEFAKQNDRQRSKEKLKSSGADQLLIL